MQQFHRQMRDAPAPGGGIGQFARLFLGKVDQLRQRFDAKCRRDRDENLGGALKIVVFANCQLVELKRRTSWLGLED